MLSRVAENTFWMGRYMERTNTQLRNLKTYYIASQDGIPYAKWEEIYAAFNMGQSPVGTISISEILHFILFDKDNDGSVLNNIFRARENARSAQDHITKELWQCLNDYYLLVKDPVLQKQITHGDPVTVFDQLIYHCMLYYGVIDISMFRSEGYNYLCIGKYVERILQSTNNFRQQLHRNHNQSLSGMNIVSWRYFLISMSGYEYYLKSNSGTVNPTQIFKQVFFEMDFPHSAAYCLTQLNRYAQKLKADSKPESFGKIDFVIGKAIAYLNYNNPENDVDSQLQFIQNIQENVLKVVDTFNRHYYGLTG